MAEEQAVRLSESLTGPLSVKAKLAGDTAGSPVLWPGSQVLAGTVQTSGSYYTRSIPANGAEKAVLLYSASIPSGASVTPGNPGGFRFVGSHDGGRHGATGRRLCGIQIHAYAGGRGFGKGPADAFRHHSGPAMLYDIRLMAVA